MCWLSIPIVDSTASSLSGAIAECASMERPHATPFYVCRTFECPHTKSERPFRPSFASVDSLAVSDAAHNARPHTSGGLPTGPCEIHLPLPKLVSSDATLLSSVIPTPYTPHGGFVSFRYIFHSSPHCFFT